MAGRNVKRGLMYFRLDCDLFQDRKLKRLMRRWQNDGLAVYLALLCEIYRDKGYYIVADKDLIADIADTCLLDDDRTSNIFRDCIELGLFDRQLYEHRELLTSRGIQARYLDIMAVLRRKAGIDAEYSLISSEEIGDNSATIDDDSERIADSSVKIRKNTQKCRFMQNDSEDIPQSAEETAIPSDKKEKKNKENNGKTDTHTHGIEEREGGAGETMPENDRLALASFGHRWNELARHEKNVFMDTMQLSHHVRVRTSSDISELPEHYGENIGLARHRTAYGEHRQPSGCTGHPHQRDRHLQFFLPEWMSF